jgi:hypothetical protein
MEYNHSATYHKFPTKNKKKTESSEWSQQSQQVKNLSEANLLH